MTIDDSNYGGTLPFPDECPAGGEHTWVDNSVDNSDAYHARPGQGAHCDECGATYTGPRGRDEP